jgi:DNA-binding NarL/FixJ family response regulator
LVLAEDHFLIREGTTALLGGVAGLEVVATAGDLDSLMETVAAHRPDVVLTDIRMPPTHSTEGITGAKQIRRQYPGTGVLVLSQYADADYAYQLLEDGAAGLGYLLKERVADLDDIVKAVHEVAAGGSVLDPRVVEALVSRQRRTAESPLDRLTRREREVLEHMAQGRNNAGIAAAMVITERAVENYINTVFSKLGVAEEQTVHRRVMAVLTLLRASDRNGAAATG